MSVPTRKLGSQGPEVAAIGLGCMGLSAFYGVKKPDTERLAFLDHAFAIGARNWDSADIYGDNEDLLKKWFEANPGKREQIFLATKFGNCRKPDGSVEVRNDPEYIKSALEKSLKRLGLDSVDLFYCHRVQESQPIEVTVKTLAELKRAGKIKYIGLSEVSADTLRRACKVEHIDAVQMEYSPFSMDIEDKSVGLLKACRELGVATIAYSPLGRGFLTGSITSRDDFEEGDWRLNAPRFSKDNFHKNLELVQGLQKIAEKKGCTPGQLTLAWLMAQGDDIIPIPGTTREKNLDENMGSLKVKLTKDEEAEIRKLIEEASIQGDRYPSAAGKFLLADTVPYKE